MRSPHSVSTAVQESDLRNDESAQGTGWGANWMVFEGPSPPFYNSTKMETQEGHSKTVSFLLDIQIKQHSEDNFSTTVYA